MAIVNAFLDFVVPMAIILVVVRDFERTSVSHAPHAVSSLPICYSNFGARGAQASASAKAWWCLARS